LKKKERPSRFSAMGKAKRTARNQQQAGGKLSRPGAENAKSEKKDKPAEFKQGRSEEWEGGKERGLGQQRGAGTRVWFNKKGKRTLKEDPDGGERGYGKGRSDKDIKGKWWNHSAEYCYEWVRTRLGGKQQDCGKRLPREGTKGQEVGTRRRYQSELRDFTRRKGKEERGQEREKEKRPEYRKGLVVLLDLEKMVIRRI